MESRLKNASSSINELNFHGSFIAHAIPGTIFFCFGLWWSIAALQRYFRARLSSSTNGFSSSSCYSCACCCIVRLKRAPLEAMLKIFFCGIGMAIEAVIGFWWGDVARMQQFTIYAFFGFSGVMDLGIKYQALRGTVPSPSGHMILAVSFLVEGLLFQFHLNGRAVVDVTLHTLLVYCCYATAVVIFLESKFRHSISLSLSRSLLGLIQGTWLWQVGSIISPPMVGENQWNLHSAQCANIVTVLFTWHILSNILLVCICAIIVHRCTVLTLERDSPFRLQLHTNNNNNNNNEDKLESAVSVNRHEIKNDVKYLLSCSESEEDF